MKKFVAVMNIPSPYRLHLLGVLAKQLNSLGIEFHCHFMAKGHADRPQSWLNPSIEFAHTYWRDWGWGQYHFNPGLIIKMMFSKSDWMICGSSFDTFTGIGVQLFGRAKTKIAWLEGNTKTPGKLNGFIGWFKRLIIGKCRFAAVPGSDAAKYIGLHQERTKKRMPVPIYLPNLVNESRFTDGERHNGSERVCIIPARLEPVKGLIQFFTLLNQEILCGWQIKLLGQGPLKDDIIKVLKTNKIEDRVDIIDYVPYEDMPKWYKSADLLLLPSVYDPNPLSVIEALHSGLAVAVTSQAGNVEEAVTEGENGWVLPVMDKLAFSEKLKLIFSTPLHQLRIMGENSKKNNAKFWLTEVAISNFIRGVGIC